MEVDKNVEFYIGIDATVPTWIFYEKLKWKSRIFNLKRS